MELGLGDKAYNELKDTNLQTLMYQIKNTEKNVNDIKQKINLNVKTIEAKTFNIETMGQAKQILSYLKLGKMDEKKEFILNTINVAISDIFAEEGLKIDIVSSSSSDKDIKVKYDIVLFQNGQEISKNEKMLQQNGGGLISFISMLLKILVGFLYSRNKFFLFDESLAEVSKHYRPKVGQFLRKLCETHGFTILLISQADDITEEANIGYVLDREFDDGVIKLLKDEIHIREDNPSKFESNYVYTEIENFQSIKKIDFKFYGFCTIVGPNNIGKSATFRAINSLLFNTFDSKIYPRKTKEGKLLNTRVKFGVCKDGVKDEMLMYKKGQSIKYEFDGNTFTGKTLAFDAIRDKAETFGFKYVKVSETYKNFKGNIKDQTERLALTTQQDGYYIIGAKPTESNKVFDFLFDTSSVTKALNNIQVDINADENEINSLTTWNAQQERAIKFTELKIQLMKKIYNQKLIDDYMYTQDLVDTLGTKISIGGRLLTKLKYFLNITNKINTVNNINQTKQNLLVGIKSRNVKIEKLKELNEKYTKSVNRLNMLNNYFNLNKQYQLLKSKVVYSKIQKFILLNQLVNHHKHNTDTINKKINILKQILEKTQYIQRVNEAITKLNNSQKNVDNCKSVVEISQKNLQDFMKNNNIQKCSVCGGNGFVGVQHGQ